MGTSVKAITSSSPLLPISASPSEISSEYEGHTYTNLPSMWNVVFAPLELWKSTKTLIATKLLPGSHEMILDAGIRLLQAPVLFTQGLTGAALNVMNAARASGLFQTAAVVTNNLLKASAALGLVSCALEAAFETPSFYRTLTFLKRAKTHKPDFQLKYGASPIDEARNRLQKFLDQSEFLHEHLSAKQAKAVLDFCNKHIGSKPIAFKYNYIYANNYLDEIEHQVENSIAAKKLTQLRNLWLDMTPDQQKRLNDCASLSERDELESSMLQQNKNRLAGRVMPCGVFEVTSKLPNLLQELNPKLPSGDRKRKKPKSLTIKEIESQAEARAAANKLLKDLKIQAKKKLRYHAMGYAAVGLTALGIGIGIAFPYVGLAFGILAGVVSMSRWIYLRGTCLDLGWEFKWNRCWDPISSSIRTLLQTPLQFFRWLR